MSETVYAPCYTHDEATHEWNVLSDRNRFCLGRPLGTIDEIDRALRIVARMDIGGVGITEIDRALQIAHAHDSGLEGHHRDE